MGSDLAVASEHLRVARRRNFVGASPPRSRSNRARAAVIAHWNRSRRTSRGGSSLESITVSKCYCNATPTSGGQMLIKASSPNARARLFAYRPDGSLIGEVQSGGGGRYGGTVMPWQPYDPIYVTITSTAGAKITVPTTRFQL